MSNPIDVNHAVVSLVYKKSSVSMKTMQNIGGQVTAGSKTPLVDKIVVCILYDCKKLTCSSYKIVT